MEPIINQMLAAYPAVSITDKKNALKEVMQEIVLCGLSRTDFFKHAAFYGGTALRIFYGLDRFSEDLDFSLDAKNEAFNFDDYVGMLEKEVNSYGFNFKIETKTKTKDSDIKSAFLKGSTKEHLLLFYADNDFVNTITPGELIKIKLEVDVNPPGFANYENKYRMVPIPYAIRLYDEPSLFAGKLHAVICRSWKNRVKGRDLYDYVFYLTRKSQFNLPHLQARLIDSGFLRADEQISLKDVKNILNERFYKIDFNQAKQDVLPFIKNPQVLDIWSPEFFEAITNDLKDTDI